MSVYEQSETLYLDYFPTMNRSIFKRGIAPTFLLILNACIGTDLTDKIIGQDLREAVIDESELSLISGDTQSLNFRYLGVNGKEEQADWTFTSNDENVATVNQNGLVSAINPGQTRLVGTANLSYSDTVLVTVVGDSNEVSSVVISAPSTKLMIDSTLQFSVEVRNLRGDLISNVPVSWNSSQPSIGAIDPMGLLTGLSMGVTQVSATAESVTSSSISIEVSDESGRTGTFSGLNGYSVSGSATLSGDVNSAVLELGSNFASQSGPGLRVVLGKNGSNTSGGLDLGALMASSGMQTYALPVGTDPGDFSHVFIYCQPFSIPFGVAALN